MYLSDDKIAKDFFANKQTGLTPAVNAKVLSKDLVQCVALEVSIGDRSSRHIQKHYYSPFGSDNNEECTLKEQGVATTVDSSAH